jgi:hypothetical protein
MTKTVHEKLSELMESVKALPAATQEALVEEFSERLSDFSDSGLTEAQRFEVDRRLANPSYADGDEIHAFFARYGSEIP